MKQAGLGAVMLAVAFSAGAYAQGTAQHGHDSHGTKPAQTEQKAHAATGTIMRIEAAKSKVVINHDAIPSIKWPAMTMAFDVKDKALFDKLKPGAKVEFSFVESGKSYLITQVK